MMMIRHKKLKRLCLAGMAAVIVAGAAFPALAADAWAPGEDYGQFLERLCDNRIEYDELADLMKNFYGPIKSGYDMIDGIKGDMADMAMQMRVQADDLVNDVDGYRDIKKDNPQMSAAMNQAIAGTRAGIKQLRKGAKKIEDNLDSVDSQKKGIDRSVNTAVRGLEFAINQYQQLLSQRALVAKAVELSQAAWNLQQTMQAQGLAVDSGILSAAAQLSSARQQLDSLDAGIESVYNTICELTGYDVTSAHPEIGPVPHADPSVIASIDVAADKDKAAINNYNMITMRQSGGSKTMLETQLMKSTTETRNKIRNVEYGEEQVRSNIQTLYDSILEAKAKFDSASTAWQSAQISWDAAQIQRQNGLISDIQYMQAEVGYLTAKSGYECADLTLQQALRDYEWAVKGVSVTPAA